MVSSFLNWQTNLYIHISGATKSVYAPEPFDVGRILQAAIVADGQLITVATTAPIDPGSPLDPGLQIFNLIITFYLFLFVNKQLWYVAHCPIFQNNKYLIWLM